jgi:hypothetical protein
VGKSSVDRRSGRQQAATSSKTVVAASSDSELEGPFRADRKRKAGPSDNNILAKKARRVDEDELGLIDKGKARRELAKARRMYESVMVEVEESERRVAAALSERVEIVARARVAAQAFANVAGLFV